jgi:ribulose-5-phosphate 4-epimerase/fuculose-1-phosphate aldolase
MLDTICDVMKRAYSQNWISTRDGNASYRRKDEPHLYITPSGVRKQLLTAEMMLKLKFPEQWDENDVCWNQLERIDDDYQRKIIGLDPSGELPLHVLLQRKVPENRVVLHLHPTYTVAAIHAGLDLQQLTKDFPEINRYTRVGPTVPMIPPVSKELAYASVSALSLNEFTGEVNYDIIGLDRHGIIAIGKDAWSAFEHCERLEHICKIALASKNYTLNQDQD